MGLKDVPDSFGFEGAPTFSVSPAPSAAIPKIFKAMVAKRSISAADLVGEYQAPGGCSLLFNLVDDQTLRYSLKVVKPCMGKPELTCCMGELYGLIFTGANPARSIHYTKEEGQCILTFSLSKEDIVVSEKNCFTWHGVSCDFEGVYLKK